MTVDTRHIGRWEELQAITEPVTDRGYLNIIGQGGVKLVAGAEIRRFAHETVFLRLPSTAEQRVTTFQKSFTHFELLLEAKESPGLVKEVTEKGEKFREQLEKALRKEENKGKTREQLNLDCPLSQKEEELFVLLEGKKQVEVREGRKLTPWQYIFRNFVVNDAHDANFKRELYISLHVDTKEFVLFDVILPIQSGDVASQMSYLHRVAVDQSRMNRIFYSIIGILVFMEAVLIANILEWIEFDIAQDWAIGWYAAFGVYVIMSFRSIMKERIFWATYFLYGITNNYPIRIEERRGNPITMNKEFHLKNATLHHLFLYYSSKVDPREVLSTKVERKVQEQVLAYGVRTIALLEERDVLLNELTQLKNAHETVKKQNVELEERITMAFNQGINKGYQMREAPLFKRTHPAAGSFLKDIPPWMGYTAAICVSVFITIFFGLPVMTEFLSGIDVPSYMLPVLLLIVAGIVACILFMIILQIWKAFTASESRRSHY